MAVNTIEDNLSCSIDLDSMREMLRMYCRALSGRDVDVQNLQHLIDKNIGWSRGDLPTTDGSTIYLPSFIETFPTNAQNFALLKVMSTYQAGHIEFGSFNFALARPSTQFHDLRPRLTHASGATSKETDPRHATDMSRFLRLFPEKRLALDIFSIVESSRIEASVMTEYRGMAVVYRNMQARALDLRPKIDSLPAREALLEFMIRVSLGQKDALKVPANHIKLTRQIDDILGRIAVRGSTVEDAAEATLRIYALLSAIVNEKVPAHEFVNFEPEGNADKDEEIIDPELVLRQLQINLRSNVREKIKAYSSPQEVDYRGDFKPELAQLLSLPQPGARRGETSQSKEPATQQQIEELVKNAAELQMKDSDDEGYQRPLRPEQLGENLLKELARQNPENEDFQQGWVKHSADDGWPLEATRSGTFVYDEWDFCAAEYKRRWCRVHEKAMASGDAAFYRNTLIDRARLAQQIRNEFEMLVPEVRRKVKRLEDGEEQDLDAVIEAMTELRAGVTPSEKLFWRRNKTERDVSVAFLLDMSASTAEAIDDETRPAQHAKPRSEPADRTERSRSRATWPPYRRIIDVEKEGVVLLVNALETLGDTYGIYGFSGYGRENVEFYIIKDLVEPFSWDVAKRIDRIMPQHTTRMGPAIRHATSKLKQQEAKSKFMFLISDGRPQDRGYSRPGVEREYAVHDTRMALIEARHEGITPFCLTIDKSGHDYLRTMMDDFCYEVLSDVILLPARLPRLYKRLTT